MPLYFGARLLHTSWKPLLSQSRHLRTLGPISSPFFQLSPLLMMGMDFRAKDLECERSNRCLSQTLLLYCGTYWSRALLGEGPKW
jgi:hypothetical protein